MGQDKHNTERGHASNPLNKNVGKTSLSSRHEEMLRSESGIGRGVIEARGYRTVTTKAELERLGFGRYQRNVPGLLLPLYSPTGDLALYQYRPDEPRVKDGKPVKYETPSRSKMVLDVHPAGGGSLRDPSVPVVITEGVKKADAATSRGLCVLGLIGVWNWRGTNEHGGTTVLAEWEEIALKGRDAYIVFDSDVMLKPQVHAALVRLKAFLELRGANVALVYLPVGREGRKQGMDDFLATGRSVDEMLSLATTELRSTPSRDSTGTPYRVTPTGMVMDRDTPDGTVTVPLANFSAYITSDVIEDDGAETRRSFELEAEVNGRPSTFSIPAAQFPSMGWVGEHVGASAIVYPGTGVRDHARAAVQTLSGDVPVCRIYAHTGWRQIEGEWVYLHAAGAIGRDGVVDGVRTGMNGFLADRVLPDPPKGEELVRAIKASLRVLELAPGKISVPLLSATYRASLGESDSQLHVGGQTGEGKSELVAICQQHYGAGQDARHLLSWASTGNAIERQAFLAKDQVLPVDDFVPGGSDDARRAHAKADRVMRAKGNASGRQRLYPDTTLRPETPPRAMILSTGEDVPRGQSLGARFFLLELGPGQLDWAKLSDCQRDAADGAMARAMAGYVRYLAPRYAEVRSGLRDEYEVLRQAASIGGRHRRTPGILADLALGLRHLLRFAYDAGALSAGQAEEIWARGWEALEEAAACQGKRQATGEPTARFGELLRAAVASGRAHVAGPEGAEPASSPEAWGWRLAGGEWRPQGERVGWVDGVDLYLEPEASYAVAQRQGRDSEDPLPVTNGTLRRRLKERGTLRSTDAKRETLTVRRTFEGSRRSVLHVSSAILGVYAHAPDQPDREHYDPRSRAGSVPPLWSGCDLSRRSSIDQAIDQGE